MIGGERWSEILVLNTHKSSHGDQRSSTFNLNAGELSWNVLLTRLAIVVVRLSTVETWVQDTPEITCMRSNPET